MGKWVLELCCINTKKHGGLRLYMSYGGEWVLFDFERNSKMEVEDRKQAGIVGFLSWQNCGYD